MVPVSFNWRQLIPYCLIKEKVIGSSLVLPEETNSTLKMSYTIFDLIKLSYTSANSMNSLEILDTAQKRRIYCRNNQSCTTTIRLTQLLDLYLTRSEQCRLARTRTASNPFNELTNPSSPLWFTFRKSGKIYSR